ncbi:MAG TPA: c-type cytochrome [Burkholderiales bacterium]
MNKFAVVLTYAFLAIVAGVPADAADSLPVWAYPVNPPGLKAAPDDGTLKQVPNSAAAFTMTQIRDLFSPPDWHPDNHPPMPDVVGRGNKPGQFACGFCHLPNGLGRPENSSLAGLPAAYIAQQVADFKSGVRKSSEPASLPINLMVAVAKLVSEEDARTAAEYFASLKSVPWIRVVETQTVPKTKVGGWMLIADEGAGTEAIGQRIIEMPENLERTELRDSASGFVAYVPAGSISKGETLITKGAGKTTPCAICHGAGLRGLGPVPALAGRSPSYIVRQLYDMQHGVRNGQWSELMKSVVAGLSDEDLVAIAAYTASLAP